MGGNKNDLRNRNALYNNYPHFDF